MAIVPTLSIVFCVVTLLLAIGLPLGLVIWCALRGKSPALRAVGIGALCFIVGAMVLEQACHQAVMALFPGVSTTSLGFGLYGALAAGVFEETARLLGLRWLCKTHPEPLTGFAYGVGHGGIEAIMLGGMAAISNLSVLLMVRSQGVAALVAQYPAEQQSLAQTQLESLLTLDPSLFLASGVERAVSICLHIALSMLIYLVVTKRLPLWGYPVAILLHAGADCFAMAYQQGLFTNIWGLEALIALYVAAVAFGVYWVWKKTAAPAVEQG